MIPKNKRHLIVNKEYSRLPYWTDDGYEDVQRQVSQKYVQDTFGKFAESENQPPYLSDADYQGLEYQYQNPEFFDPTDLPDVDMKNTAPKGTCYELWVSLFGSSPYGFFPTASEYAQLMEYAKKCPLIYMPHWCCSPSSMKISGPASVAPGEKVEYTVSGGLEGCSYRWDADRGWMVSGTYEAPDTPGSDRITVSPYLSDDMGKVCAFKDITIEGGCHGVIGPYTPQMEAGASQTLSVTGGSEYDDYYWAATTGSLSSNKGASVVYTAPTTNPNCANNPTISLSCGGNVVSHIHIAVNAVSTDNAYFTYTLEDYENCNAPNVLNGSCCEIYSPPNPIPAITNCQYTRKFYKCDGTYSSTTDKAYTSTQASFWKTCDDCKNQKSFSGLSINDLIAIGVKDNRTSGMKAAGCCPAALL